MAVINMQILATRAYPFYSNISPTLKGFDPIRMERLYDTTKISDLEQNKNRLKSKKLLQISAEVF